VEMAILCVIYVKTTKVEIVHSMVLFVKTMQSIF
jgi:hypothetical protein